MERGGCIYIMTNAHHTTLYTGVTSDLQTRIQQHQIKEFSKSFSAKYNCNKLVYYECFSTIEEAITREKNIKEWKREWKDNLINSKNPDWLDLSEEVLRW